MEYSQEWNADAVLGVGSIKGEISSILTLMRWTESYRGDGMTDNAEGSLVRSFRYLNEALEGVFDLREVNCVTYIAPFHQVIVSRGTSGPLTSAALSSLSKFALYGFLNPHFPGIEEGIEMVAECISGCIFEETDWESDEVIFMKMLELSALTFRCDASSMLSVRKAWEIYKTCLNIHHQNRASKILKSEAESTLRHLTLTTFSRAIFVSSHQIQHRQNKLFSNKLSIIEVQHSKQSIEGLGGLSSARIDIEEDIVDAVKSESDADVDNLMWNKLSSNNKFGEDTGVIIILCKIMNSLSTLMDMQSGTQTIEGVKFALSLVNIALEAGGPALGSVGVLVDIMRGDMCRHLLRASQSDDLAVFGLALRVVFNLFVSIKDHMKVQLEVYLTSVHIRLLRQGLEAKSLPAGSKATDKSLVSIAVAREELALESLLDFCREPSLMCDIYSNYDCDVQCTNLFRTIIESLCARAIANTKKGTKGRVNRGVNSGTETESSSSGRRREVILNRLALDGVFAVLHAVATRVVSKKARPPSAVSTALVSQQGSIVSDEESAARSRTESSATSSSSSAPDLPNHSTSTAAADSRDVAPPAPPLSRAYSDPVAASRRELSPETDRIGDQVDAWCSSEPGTPNNEEADGTEEEGFFLGGEGGGSPSRARHHPGLVVSTQGTRHGRGQGQAAQYPSYFSKSRSLSYSPPGSGKHPSADPEQDYHVPQYPEFSGYAQDHFEVEVEVLRKRKLRKQHLGEVAEMFNSRPLKPEWLRRALELGCIEQQSPDDMSSEDGTDTSPKQKWDPSKYRSGLDSNLALADPAAVAAFLRNTPGLGKPEIGEFISKGPADKYPYFTAVLHEYVHTFSFPPDSGFSQALRTFLGTFRMPGESQCIDRLMEAFSAKLFLDLGPGRPFVNADAAFILAFSTIILNTDLHNPNLPPAKRMTKEAFIKNNRDINDGKDLPREYLSRLYDEIRTREIQVDMEVTDDGESLASHLSGIDHNAWHRLLDRSAADQAPAAFTPTVSARFSHSAHARRPSYASSAISLQDRDMFLVMATPVLDAMDSVWAGPLAGDDLLTGRMIEGVVDYAAICVSLGLRDILTTLIETLSLRAKAMLSHPSHLAGLARSYGDENTEANIIYLLGPGFEAMLKSVVPRGVDAEARETASPEGDPPGAMDESGFFANPRWRGAHLVGGELVLRALFYIIDKHAEALNQQSWAALLDLLMWVRRLGSLAPDLARIDDGAAFWCGEDPVVTSSAAASSGRDGDNALNRPSAFALQCHASAKGLRRMADGRYRSIDDNGQDSKGLWGAVTGILFGSVTLTEDADTYLEMQQQGQRRKDRAGPLDREKEKEIETLDGNSSRRVTSFLRGHYYRKELLRATLIYSRANEMLSPSSPADHRGLPREGSLNERSALFEAMFAQLQSKTSTFCAQVSSQRHSLRYTGRSRGGDVDRDEDMGRQSEGESDYESIILTTDDDEASSGRESMPNGEHEGEQGTAEVFEIEAVLALEWVGSVALSLLQTHCLRVEGPHEEPQAWSRLREYILSLLQRQTALLSSHPNSDEDDPQQSLMQCPYLLERAVCFCLRACMIEAAQSVYMKREANSSPSYWQCLALISSCPRAILNPIASKFGAACASLVHIAVHSAPPSPCLVSSLEQWHVLLSLLAAASASFGGRPQAWKGLCHVLDSRHLNTVSFAPSRLLLLRFLHGAYPGDEDEEQSRSKNTFLQPAMGRLVGLIAMLLGGYSPEGRAVPEKEDTAATPTKETSSEGASLALMTRHGERASFLLPKRRGTEPSLAPPNRRTSTAAAAATGMTPVQLAHSSYREASANDPRAAPHSAIARRFISALPSASKGAEVEGGDDESAPYAQALTVEEADSSNLNSRDESVLTVRVFTLESKETEHLWLDTVHRLAEIVDPRSHSVEVSRLACYHLRSVLTFGSAVELPLNLWVQVLNDLIARLPLSLLPLAGSSPSSLSSSSSSSVASEGRIHNFSAGSCLSSCHVMLEVLTNHTRVFREANSLTFAESWLRFSALLAQNARFATQHASSSASSSSVLLLRHVHDEVVDIVIALLKALRPPPDKGWSLERKAPTETDKGKNRAPSRRGGLIGMLFGGGGEDGQEDEDIGLDSDGEGSRQPQSSELSVDASRALMALGNKDHDAALLQTTWQTMVAQYPSIDAAIKARDPGFCKTLRASIRVVDAATKVLSAMDKAPKDVQDAQSHESEIPKSSFVPPVPEPVPEPAAEPGPARSHHPETHVSPVKARRTPLPSIQVRGVSAATPPRYPRGGGERPAGAHLSTNKPIEATAEVPRTPVTLAATAATVDTRGTPPPKPAPEPVEVLTLRSPMPLQRFLLPAAESGPRLEAPSDN